MRKGYLILAGITLFSGAVFCLEISWISGSEFDTKGQSFYYTALTTGKEVGTRSRILGRFWIDHLTYRFTAGDRRVEARAPSFQISGGIGYVRDQWRTNFYLGYERRRTEVKPDVPGIRVKGEREGAVLQGEVFGWFPGKTGLSIILSYSGASSYLWGMLSADKGILFSGFRAGFEVIGQGNPDYRSFQGGIRAGFRKGAFSSGIRGGYKDSSTGRGAYGGFELFVSF